MSGGESTEGQQLHYVGTELHLFQHARNWKRYWSSRVVPYLGRSVIEVGAGFGANVPLLCVDQESWLSIEPDPALAGEYAARAKAGQLPAICRILNGVLADIPANVSADTVLYVDVMEHIENDAAEFRLAASHLRPGGHLIVLGPAHQALYSPFDAAIGHYRRYDRAAYTRLTPLDIELIRVEYLDSVGMFASFLNKAILRSATPTLGQVRVWDGMMVPASIVLDVLLLRSVGRSILGVWKRT